MSGIFYIGTQFRQRNDFLHAIACQETNDATPIVLVVEDNADISRYIGSELKKSYTLRYACNGKEGAALTREIIPDFVCGTSMTFGGKDWNVLRNGCRGFVDSDIGDYFVNWCFKTKLTISET